MSMAVSKPLLPEFGIHHRLESCDPVIFTVQEVVLTFARRRKRHQQQPPPSPWDSGQPEEGYHPGRVLDLREVLRWTQDRHA